MIIILAVLVPVFATAGQVIIGDQEMSINTPYCGS